MISTWIFPGVRNGYPLQYACLENSMDRQPGGLPSMGSHRVGHDWSDSAAAAALEMNRDHSVIFEIASKYCILDSFVDYNGYSIFSKGFLPTVVDIMVIWVRFSNPVHFISLIPKMSMFTLAIYCLTTSNLPWFMDLTFQIPRQYCSLQHWTLLLSPVPTTTLLPSTVTSKNWFCFGSISSFFLELFLHWSPVSILGRLSRVFSNTTVQKRQFFSTQPSSQSNSHIHTWPQGKP